MNSLVTLTRYHGTNDRDLEQLDRFIAQAQTYSKQILIGVNRAKDLSNCLEKRAKTFALSHSNVVFLPIEPWLGISSPLNILLNSISVDEKFVLIQSIEIRCDATQIDHLRSFCSDDNVLCVGVALDGHQFYDPDRVDFPLQGDTSPWNTFIIWNVEKLRRTGFPLCADFVQPAGMEDCAAIALQQKSFGGKERNRALLIHFRANIHWLTSFDHDEERLEKHRIKMKSKSSRTKQLLEILQINDGDRIGVEFLQEPLE